MSSAAATDGRRGASPPTTIEGDHHRHQQQQNLSISLDRLSLRDDGDESKCDDANDEHAEVQFVDYQDESQLSDVMGLVDGDLSEPYSIFTYRYFLHQWPELCTLAMLNGKAVGCVICKIDEEDVPIDDADADADAVEGGDHGHGHDAAGAGGGGEENENRGQVPEESTSTAAGGTATNPTTETDEGEGGRRSSSNDDDASDGHPPPTTNVVESESDATPVHTNSARATRKKRTGYMAMLAVSTKLRRSGIGTALVCRAVERMRDVAGCTSVVLETEVTNVAAMRLYERLGFMREELLVKYYLNWGDAYRLRLWFDDDNDNNNVGGDGGGAKHDA